MKSTEFEGGSELREMCFRRWWGTSPLCSSYILDELRSCALHLPFARWGCGRSDFGSFGAGALEWLAPRPVEEARALRKEIIRLVATRTWCPMPRTEVWTCWPRSS